MEMDPFKVKASEAYREDGHCIINSHICEDGDCRQCSFIIYASNLSLIDALFGESSNHHGDCECSCCCEEDCFDDEYTEKE